MSVRFTLISISLFLSTLSLGMAATAPFTDSASQKSIITRVHHSDTWQPLIATPKSVVDADGAKPAPAAPIAQQSASVKNADHSTAAANPPVKTKPSDNEAFINNVIKRNEVLNQLEYEKSVLTLEQEISQLKLNIKKNQTALTTAASDSASPGIVKDSAPRIIPTPQLVEVLIKNNQANAVISYQDTTFTVTSGQKFGDYTVQAITKTTVTLLKDKQPTPIVLSIFRGIQP